MSKRSLLSLVVLVGAAGLSYVTARALVAELETRTLQSVEQVLLAEDAMFAQASVDGLQITLFGSAPDEAKRFATLAAVGRIVGPDRLIDEMDVVEAPSIEPPEFSLELLRNTDEVSVIGLVPAAVPKATITGELDGLGTITNMIETADFPAPPRWIGAVDYAIATARLMPRAKISVTGSTVHITGLADTAEEKASLENRLRRTAPAGIAVTIDIAAPRPVITPFLLRFSKTETSAGFDACSAATDRGHARILAAAEEAGADRETASCTIGIGAPAPEWADAAVRGIRAVNALGGGTVTLSDADVRIVALQGTERAVFERVTAELDADLPEVFSLSATLPKEDVPLPGVFEPEAIRFTATLSPEGLAQLRGHVTDQTRKDVTATLASAMFGAANVYSATTVADYVPDGWSVRVLAGVEALSHLHNGSLTVTPDYVRLSGRLGHEEGPADVARLLAERLPNEGDLRLDVKYDPILDPVTALPTDEECFARIEEALEGQKITFDPGSSKLAEEAEAIIDRIAAVIAECAHVEIEIAGHTDSEGREVMNLNLSQARADAVLAALSDRRILTANLVAVGYGEALPIADNGTPAGREANRRIAFTTPTPPVRRPGDEDSADAPEPEGTQE